MKNRVLVFSGCLFLSCNGQDTHSKKMVIEQNEMNEWKQDENGCLKIRSMILAEKLVSENALRNKTKKDFVKIFGEPNQTENLLEESILIYFFDCVCQNNVPINGGDKCYAKFYFEQDRLNSEEFICE